MWCQSPHGKLLTLTACLLVSYAFAAGVTPLSVPAPGRAGFTALAGEQTGIHFTNTIPEARHLTNQMLLNGAGVAFGDVDGDGRCDVFLPGLSGGSALFRNLGDWQFTNATHSAIRNPQSTIPGDATGAAFADLDGDGDPDLIVNSLGQGTRILFNDDGVLRALPGSFNPGRGGMTIAIADVDGDGWLDIYLTNYRTEGLLDRPNARATFRVVGGRMIVATLDGRPTSDPALTNRFVVNATGGIEEQGEADVLLRNLGGTNFAPVSWTGGAFLDEAGRPLSQPPFDWGLAAMFRDVNGDGRPELYVANDFETPDRFWLNASTPGNIRFRAAPPGVIRHTSRFSMGLDFADVNRDGHDDLFVLDMLSRDHVTRLTQIDDLPPSLADLRGDPLARPQFDMNVLQLGRGDGTFAEAAAFAGLSAAEWAWGAAFLDVDLDGWEDLLVTNGQERAARDADVAKELQQFRAGGRRSDAEIFTERRKFPRLAWPNLAFRNDGTGRFRETGAEWGFDFHGVSHGLAFADLDGDGDLDALVNNLNAPASVYRNESPAPRVAVRLRGIPPNRAGIGARISVRAGNSPLPPEQAQEVIAGGRYLSGDEPLRVFAAPAGGMVAVTVRWPSGKVSTVSSVPANSLVEVEESSAQPAPVTSQAPASLGVVEALPFGHAAAESDELERQPLLPRQLTALGPGVTAVDFDRDGADELILPGGAGGPLRVLSHQGGRWGVLTNQPTRREQTAVLPLAGNLVVAESDYPRTNLTAPTLRPLRGPAFTGPALPAAPGPLAAADVDGDGAQELFVGGRVIPGRWPVTATSHLLRRQGEGFTVTQALADIGLVSGAVFSDLDGDGDPDLALACDAGPLKLFRNERGQLAAWNPEVTHHASRITLSEMTGFWNSVTAGDFDGDGRMDLVGGNWGENSGYELYRETAARGRGQAVPLTVLHGGLDADPSHDIMEAYGVAGALRPLHSLAQLGKALPWLAAGFTTHRNFAQAGAGEILGERMNRAERLEIRWLATTLLLNRETHFEVRALPTVAQLAPVFGLGVADFDGNGTEDLLLAQNFFGQQFGLPRNDAGRITLLLGDGAGGFAEAPLRFAEGLIPGEGRGLAVTDFNADGRPDAFIAQHDGPVCVLRNEQGLPGVRVRLAGGGIGALLRWITPTGRGPARELRAGGGYWSCDSETVVLPRLAGAERLEVRWPGGRTTTTALPPEARAVEIVPDGSHRSLP